MARIFQFSLVVLFLCCWGVCPSLASRTQHPDSVWIKQYFQYYHHDHQGNTDSLIYYGWKAFYIARSHQDVDKQLFALSKMTNVVHPDSLHRALVAIDTFPESVLKVRTLHNLQSSYYNKVLDKASQADVHRFVKTMIQKADSVYADSLYDPHDEDAHAIYLLTNKSYLGYVINWVHFDNVSSPFYPYFKRYTRIVERLPARFLTDKLNAYLHTSALSLSMGDYASALAISENVLQSIRSMKNVSTDFQQMQMSYASICYYMCYQQLQCYDLISPETLARNWSFIHSPYGEKCHEYLDRFDTKQITPSPYYYMALGDYPQVIALCERYIEAHAEDLSMRHPYVVLQTEAIQRSRGQKRYLAYLYRNYAYKRGHLQYEQQEKEIDYTSLFSVIQLREANAQKQLAKTRKQVTLFGRLLAGSLVVLGLALWGLIGIYRSNKRKHRLSESLRRAIQDTNTEKTQTERAQQMQTTCLNNMNHEIRSPLNTIVGFSEVLLEEQALDQESKATYVAQIDTSSTMLLQIINDVLDTAQLESGNYTLCPTSCAVHVICQHALQSQQHRVQPGVEMRLDLHVSPDTQLYIDKTRLLQILFNFLSNACKHTSQGTITLSCHWTDSMPRQLEFRVTDTGRGVPASKQPQLFQRFAKLNDQAQGTGLGLHISSTLAHIMGGDIGYDATYTDGARFYIRFTSPCEESS